MTTIAWSMVLALLALAAVVLFQIERKKSRRRRLVGLELRPNCLLTRYPIAFVSGRKSVFRLFDHWNEIPSYLREHGYEVLLLESPRHDSASQSAAILSALGDLGEKCHVVADSSSTLSLELIAKARHENVASLTLVRNASVHDSANSGAKAKLRPSDLRPLESAVEIFEIKAEEIRTSVSERMALVLLRAHNLLVLGRGRMVDAFEIAEVAAKSPWALEARFLELAIELAERDASGS